MTPEQRIENRRQLKQCFMDLATRCDELGEKSLHPVCLVIAGTIADGSDDMLAIWLCEYAKIRVAMLKKEE